MTRAASATPAEPVSGPGPHDAYLRVLCWSLAGYAVLGRGFAALGVPPLVAGEVLLAAGLLVLMRSRCLFAALGSPASLLLAVLMGWVVLRTLPFVGAYGIDALRDSVVVVYGLFALVTVALLLEDPARLPRVLRLYARFAWFYAPLGGWLSVASGVLWERLNELPVTVFFVRPGEAATHVGAAAVFAIVGLRRVSAGWCVLVLVSVALVTVSRAAMLACLVPPLVAVVLGGHLRRVVPAALIGLALLTPATLADLRIPLQGDREIGPALLLESVSSMVTSSNAANFEGTKEFRLRWWAIIQDYTLHGPYFWTGKGFGANLALEDGYRQWITADSVLRSPHNGHMTILARAGVPGLALWIAMLAAWFCALGRGHLIARRQGDARWAAVFLWIACYGAGFLINASFDVALEGPMVGIWFWCVFGLGIGAGMIHAAGLGRVLDG